MATRAQFGLAAELVRAETIAAAIEEVARSRADFAVVPYETAKDGPILPTILAIAAADLKVVGERQVTQALEEIRQLAVVLNVANWLRVEA